MGVRYLKHKGSVGGGSATDNPAAIPSDIPLEPDNGEGQATAPLGRDNQPAGTPPAATPVDSGSERPALFELGVEGGWLRFGNTLGSTSISLESRTTDIPSFNLFLQNRLRNGWALGTSVTLTRGSTFQMSFLLIFNGEVTG